MLCSLCQEKSAVLVSIFADQVKADFLANYTKIMVVRHPISRFISAYWDKMTMTKGVHSKVQRSVLKQQRHTITEWELKNSWPTFREFAKMRLDDGCRYQNERHWTQEHKVCSPCAIQYDYILKLESLDVDIDLFINLLVTAKIPEEHLQFLVGVKNRNRHTVKNESFALEMKNLTQTETNSITELYNFDMELFGYDFDTETGRMYSQDLTDCAS